MTPMERLDAMHRQGQLERDLWTFRRSLARSLAKIEHTATNGRSEYNRQRAAIRAEVYRSVLAGLDGVLAGTGQTHR